MPHAGSQSSTGCGRSAGPRGPGLEAAANCAAAHGLQPHTRPLATSHTPGGHFPCWARAFWRSGLLAPRRSLDSCGALELASAAGDGGPGLPPSSGVACSSGGCSAWCSVFPSCPSPPPAAARAHPRFGDASSAETQAPGAPSPCLPAPCRAPPPNSYNQCTLSVSRAPPPSKRSRSFLDGVLTPQLAVPVSKNIRRREAAGRKLKAQRCAVQSDLSNSPIRAQIFQVGRAPVHSSGGRAPLPVSGACR